METVDSALSWNTDRTPVRRRSINTFNMMLGEQSDAARNSFVVEKPLVDDKPAEPPSLAKLFVTSKCFDRCVAMIILLNAVYIGFVTEYMAASELHDDPIAFQVVEAVFFLVFSMELGMRIYVFKCSLFRLRTPEGLYNHKVYWNYLESTIIFLQALETILMHIPFGSTRFKGLSINRILRLMRLVRILRIFKVTRHVADLRMIIYSIWRSISLFFWSIMALVLLNFIVSVYFTEFVVAAKLNGQIADASELDLYFGSLVRTMIILFQAVSGGLDWGAVTDVLSDQTGEWAVLPFIFYVVFYQVAVLNVISGVFLDKAMEIAKAEKDIYIVRNARRIFMAVDRSKAGTITWDNFQSALAHPRMQKFFEAVDIRPTEARTLFELLDTSGDGEISADEFLNGCLRVRGHSKALDLLILSREVSSLFDKQQAFNWHLSRMSKTLSCTKELAEEAPTSCVEEGAPAGAAPGEVKSAASLDTTDDGEAEGRTTTPLGGGMRRILSEGFGLIEERLRTLEGGLQGQLNDLGDRVGEIAGQAKIAAETAKVAAYLQKESEKAVTERVRSIESAAQVSALMRADSAEGASMRRSQTLESGDGARGRRSQTLESGEGPRVRRSQTVESGDGREEKSVRRSRSSEIKHRRSVEWKAPHASPVKISGLPGPAGLAQPEWHPPQEHGQKDAQWTPPGMGGAQQQLHQCLFKAVYKSTVEPPPPPPPRASRRPEAEASKTTPRPAPNTSGTTPLKRDVGAGSGDGGPTVTL